MEKRKKLFYHFIFLLFPFILFAQIKKTVAVLDLEPFGISKIESKIITSRIRTELVKTNTYFVLEREKMEDILNEQKFQLSGCTSTECAIEAGQLLGVQYILTGNIGKIGKTFSIDLRLIDVETGKINSTATYDCICDIDKVLVKSTKKVIEKLTGEKVSTVEDYNDVKKPEWKILGISHDEYFRFKKSGLSYEDWVKYNDELVNPVANFIKSFFIPGLGQLSLGYKRGYAYFLLDASLITATVWWWSTRERKWSTSYEYEFRYKETGEEKYLDIYKSKQKSADFYTKIIILAISGTIANHIYNSIEAYILSKENNERVNKNYKISITYNKKYSSYISLNLRFYL